MKNTPNDGSQVIHRQVLHIEGLRYPNLLSTRYCTSKSYQKDDLSCRGCHVARWHTSSTSGKIPWEAFCFLQCCYLLVCKNYLWVVYEVVYINYTYIYIYINICTNMQLRKFDVLSKNVGENFLSYCLPGLYQSCLPTIP